MFRHRNLVSFLVAVILVAAVLAGVYQRRIRLAYHNTCLRTAARYFQVMNQTSGQGPAPRTGFIERRFLHLCYRDTSAVETSIEAHTQSLIAMGYLIRTEFTMQHRSLDQGTNRSAFAGKVSSEFSVGTAKGFEEDWWTLQYVSSNQITVVATPSQMPRWEKLVKDFDQPDSKSAQETQ